MKNLFSILALSLMSFSVLFAGHDLDNNGPDCCEDSTVDANVLLPAVETEAAIALQTEMMGEWEYTLSPEEAIRYGIAKDQQLPGNAYLRYAFQEDGTFTQVLINDKVRKTTEGSWSVTKDGQELILMMPGDLSPKHLRVGYLQMDELVLEQSAPITDPNQLNRTYFFNKI